IKIVKNQRGRFVKFGRKLVRVEDTKMSDKKLMKWIIDNFLQGENVLVRRLTTTKPRKNTKKKVEPAQNDDMFGPSIIPKNYVPEPKPQKIEVKVVDDFKQKLDQQHNRPLGLPAPIVLSKPLDEKGEITIVFPEERASDVESKLMEFKNAIGEISRQKAETKRIKQAAEVKEKE